MKKICVFMLAFLLIGCGSKSPNKKKTICSSSDEVSKVTMTYEGKDELLTKIINNTEVEEATFLEVYASIYMTSTVEETLETMAASVKIDGVTFTYEFKDGKVYIEQIYDLETVSEEDFTQMGFNYFGEYGKVKYQDVVDEIKASGASCEEE